MPLSLAELPYADSVPAEIRRAFVGAEEVIGEAEVTDAVDRLAVQMTVDLQDRNPVLLTVLHGGLYLAGMLVQRMVFPMELGYVHVARYRDQQAGGELEWHAHNHPPLAGRSVLLVDDVLDEGVTLAALLRWAQAQGADEVRSAVLVRKLVDAVEADVEPSYCALTAENRFLIGCGMDYAGYGRNLPGIYALN